MRKLIATSLAAILITLSPGPLGLRAMASVVNGTAARGARTGPAAAPAPASANSASLSVPHALTAPSVSGSNLPELAPAFSEAPAPLAAAAASVSPAARSAAPANAAPAGAPVRSPRKAVSAANTANAAAAPRRTPRESARAAVAAVAKTAAPDIAAAAASETGGDSLYASGGNLQAALSGAFGLARRSSALLAPRTSRFDSIKGKHAPAAGLRRYAPAASDARRTSAVPAAAVNAADDGRAPRASSALGRAWTAALGRFVKTITLSVFSALLVFAPGWSGAQALAQGQAPAAPAPAQVDAAPGQIAAPKDAVAIAAEKVVVRIEVSKEAVTVGDAMTLTVTVENGSDRAMTMSSVRQALEESLPFTLELAESPEDAAQPLELAPGASKTFVFKVIPFDSGTIKIEEAVLRVPASDPDKPDVEIKIPDAEFTVGSVLTPDWKKVGFKDIVDLQRGESASLLWMLALPLGVLLLIGAERLLAARRRASKGESYYTPVLEEVETVRDALARGAGSLSAADFHDTFSEAVQRLMIDLRGLPKTERDAASFARDLRDASRYPDRKVAYTDEQISLAIDLAKTAERARFDRKTDTPETRHRLLSGLDALLESLRGETTAKGDSRVNAGWLSLLGITGASFSFANAWMLLALVPVAGWIGWSLYKKRGAAGYRVSDTSSVPARKTLRQRLAWMLPVLRSVGLISLVVALAGPQMGVERQKTYVPSTDTAIVPDVSGSMGGEKLEGLKEAVRSYVIEQRRGTTNRVGIQEFSDDPYLNVPLTNDYDAILSILKEMETKGSTAMGKAMLGGISHFFKVNIRELDLDKDPRVVELRTILDYKGLASALEYAKQHPDLLDKVLQPGRTKILVIFTDGMSNTGINPIDAAAIAQNLGVRIYTVGIGVDASSKATLEKVSEMTGGVYFAAKDAEAMKDALMDINRLEKSPALVKSQVSVKELQIYFALLAILALFGEASLSNTRMRKLAAYALMAQMGLFPAVDSGKLAQNPFDGSAVQVVAVADAAREPKGLIESLPTTQMPEALRRANALYHQGNYAGALKAYADALEKHPDIPEIFFNMGNAYLRQGDVDRANASYQEYLSRVQDPVKASQAIYNMGNAAIMRKDLGQAIQLYREALRRDHTNAKAKWNLEVSMELMKQQQKDQKDGEGKQQKGKKGQKGKQKGQKGQKGDQKGDQQGDQDGEGEPGDQEGDSKGKPGDSKGEPKAGKPSDAQVKEGVDKLIEEQGKVEKQAQEGQRGAVPKNGKKAWAWLAPVAGLGAAAGQNIWTVADASANGAITLAAADGGTTLGSAAASWGASSVVFGNPMFVVGGLAVAALVAGLMIYGLRRNLKAARSLDARAPKSFRSWTGRRAWLSKFGMKAMAMVMLALAAGNPMIGEKDAKLNFGGKDVAVAVDASYSTLYAEDGRREKTQQELAAFVKKLQGTDRIGMITFSGKARTAVPLTIDYGAFEFKIDDLELEARGLGAGSDLASAVEHAINSTFKNAKKIGERKRILIVVSDGEIFDADLKDAIDLAMKNGITIYTIGVGTPEGAKIAIPKDPTEKNGEVEYLQDEETGRPAITRLNEKPLRELAERTGGAYFSSKDGSTIDSVLREVASRQQGEEVDTVKTPRSVAFWPLLLALLGLLGERSIRDPKLLSSRSTRKDENGARTMNSMALLGLAALPLSAWPQLFVAAVIGTLVMGVVLYDLWTRGSLTRGLQAWWNRKAPAEGLDRDLFELFDNPENGRDRFRPEDRETIRLDLDVWKSADAAKRRMLLRNAAADRELWRERLVALALAAAVHPDRKDPDAFEEVLSELSRAKTANLQPLEPVVLRTLAKRAGLPWLSHPSVLKPLETLARDLLDEDAAAPALAAIRAELDPASAAPKRSFSQVAGLTASAIAVASMLAGGGISAVKTGDYLSQRAQTAQTSLQIFYADDFFIFSDAYSDARIPKKVLPVLKNWHATGKVSQDQLAHVIEILRDSPDPKADNVLEAIFKNADHLAFNEDSEALLLRVLLERDNDIVWGFLQEYMQQQAKNPNASKRLIRMIKIGAEVGSDKVFNNLFYFLKSPNQEVRSEAAQAIAASLMNPARENEFLNRLTQVSEKHAKDPILQLWIEVFTLDRLSAPGAEKLPMAQVEALLTRVLATAKAADALRLAAIQQIKPGEEDKLPPPVLTMALGVMQQSLDKALAAGTITDAQALSIEKQVVRIVNDLLLDGIKLDASIETGLRGKGVLKARAKAPQYDPHDYDYEGYGHGYGYGYGGVNTGPESALKDRYTLSEYREMKAAIEAAKAKAGDVKDQSPEQREYFDRALRLIDQAIAAAEKSGVREGGTPAEKLAAEVNPLLQKLQSQLPSTDFIQMLRKEGLAPRVNMGADATWAYATGYDYAKLEALRGVMEKALESGKTFNEKGEEHELSWAQKRGLLEAVVKIDAQIDANFPGQVRPGASSAVFPHVRSALKALADGDAKLAEEATKALAEEFAKAAVKDVFWLRFEAAYKANTEKGFPSDAARLWALQFTLDRMTGPDADKFDAKGAAEFINQVAPDLLSGGGDARALDKIAEALKNPNLNEKMRGVLETEVREQMVNTLKRLDAAAKDALGAESKAYAEFRRALEEDRVVVKNDNNDARAMREVVKRFHLRQFRGAIDAAAKSSEPADAKKLASLKAWAPAVLESLDNAAAAAGIADGGSVEERLGDELRDLFYEGYRKFPAQDFNRLLEEANLADKGTSTDKDKAYRQTYSADDLARVYKFYQGLLKTGNGWGTDAQGKPKTLDTDDREYVAKSLETVYRLMEKFHPQRLGELSERPLGRVMQDLKSSDPAARAQARTEVRTRLDGASSSAELVGALKAIAAAHASDPDLQTQVASELIRALGGKLGPQIAADKDAATLFKSVLDAARERGDAKELEVWSSLRAALEARPGTDGDALREFSRAAVQARFESLVEQAETAFSSKDAMVKAGLRKTGWQHVKTLKLHHLDKLSAEVARQAKAAGTLKEDQAAAAKTVASIAPALRGLGGAAGFKSGDTPGERAAIEAGVLLHKGYMKWPAQTFLQKLRAEGLAPAQPRGGSLDAESAYNESYSKEDLAKLRNFLQKELDSKQVPNYNSAGTRAMNGDEIQYLEEAIKSVDALIEHYDDAPKTDARTMHAFAGLGLLAAAGGFFDFAFSTPGLVALAAGIVLAGIWFGRNLFSSRKASADEIAGRQARRERGPSEEVIARAKRLDIAAARLASRVSAGQFRSRFVGASGESRAEVVPYTNQDLRKINWKQSAKRQKLQVSRFEQEKDMPLMLLIDVSDSASMGRGGVDKRTVVEDAAALLALTAAHKNIPVGAIFFSDRVEGFLPPATGKKAAHRLVSRMIGLTPGGTGTDVRAGIDFLQKSLHSRAMVAVISDFLAPDFGGSLARIASRHDVRAIRAVDPAELQPMPDVGLITLRDAESGETREVDTSNKANRAEQTSKIRSRERRLEEAFSSNRIRPITLYTDGDYVRDLAEEFRAKKGRR